MIDLKKIKINVMIDFKVKITKYGTNCAPFCAADTYKIMIKVEVHQITTLVWTTHQFSFYNLRVYIWDEFGVSKV